MASILSFTDSGPTSGISPIERIERAIDRVWDKALSVTTDEAPAIDAEMHSIDVLGAGRLRFYRSTEGEGPPIVLIHSIAPGAGAHEVQPLFEQLRGKRRVYALDLPGFGLSERSKRTPTPELYAQSIVRFLVDVVEPKNGGADLVALGVSSEIAARAALEAPELVRSLTLVSPTGLGKRATTAAKQLARTAQLLFSAPVARPLYALLTRRTALKRALGKSIAGEVPEALLDQTYRSSHVPGAHLAAPAILGRTLENAHAVEELYAKLEVPTLVVHDRAAHTSFRQLTDLLRRNSHVRDTVIGPSKGLVTYEHPDVLAEAILSHAPRSNAAA